MYKPAGTIVNSSMLNTPESHLCPGVINTRGHRICIGQTLHGSFQVYSLFSLVSCAAKHNCVTLALSPGANVEG
jgi:hypothetical protein